MSEEALFCAKGPLVCADCVEDRFLHSEIQKSGCRWTCSYCQQDGTAFSIDQVASLVETALSGYTKELYDQKCDVVYQHFYEAYMGQGKSAYTVN